MLVGASHPSCCGLRPSSSRCLRDVWVLRLPGSSHRSLRCCKEEKHAHLHASAGCPQERETPGGPRLTRRDAMARAAIVATCIASSNPMTSRASVASPSPPSLTPPMCTYTNESAAIATLGTSLLIATLQQQSSRPSPGSTGTFLSPLSIYSALMLALNGAEPGTKTHQELLRLLASSTPSSNEADLNAQLAALDKMLLANSSNPTQPNKSADAGDGPCTMLIANGIFTTSSVNPEYSRLMGSLFQATTQKVAGAQEVNAWVNKQTRGEIPELLDPSQSFHTVLANALYFKGTWSHKFDKDMTQPAAFHGAAGARNVSMMKAVFKEEDRVKVESVASLYDAVELPYLGGQYSAVAALPAVGVSLEDVLRALNAGPGQSSGVSKEVQVPWKTIVSMPKFRAESSVSLKGFLQGLGVEAAFQSGANFDRLAPGLHIDEVLHKTVVDVDEEGTVAAAATAVLMLKSAMMHAPPPVVLVFDRPFVFIIRHQPSATPVFMGVVTAPPEAA